MNSQIKPQDLRYGNLIEAQGKIFTVKAIDKHIVTATRGKGNVDFTYVEINPIPITENILLMSGFQSEEFKNEYILYRGEFILKAIFSNKIPSKFLFLDINKNSTRSVKYLHDIQNLVKSLICEELEINLK